MATMTVRLFKKGSDDSSASMCLKSAFEDDPFARAFMPGQVYEDLGAEMYRKWIDLLQGFGMTYVVECEGVTKTVAAWEPDHEPIWAYPKMLLFLAWCLWKFGAKQTFRIFKLMSSGDEKRAKHAPTAYRLSVLGTVADFQGRGAGTKVLKPMLDRADRENFPCYLESSNPKNVPFYKRNGFKIVEECYPLQDWPEYRESKGPVMTLMYRDVPPDGETSSTN
ncbi:hypothetical protein CTAYLR_008736 [Chrysophaeum taylorii]|uniref:N-acetyltransferase domain-containing protein n=1 Tax=Chrysophaeum taylorii TaxID=2483200 RepID=A0AAD7XNU4_9STRA|nr:hypothetical protein CTAYLR_008736 [Chrysophaeum taylorii]